MPRDPEAIALANLKGTLYSISGGARPPSHSLITSQHVGRPWRRVRGLGRYSGYEYVPGEPCAKRWLETGQSTRLKLDEKTLEVTGQYPYAVRTYTLGRPLEAKADAAAG